MRRIAAIITISREKWRIVVYVSCHNDSQSRRVAMGDACASRAKRAVQISEEVADCRVIIGSIRCLKFNKIHVKTRFTNTIARRTRSSCTAIHICSEISSRNRNNRHCGGAYRLCEAHLLFLHPFASDRLSLLSRRVNWNKHQVRVMLEILLNCLHLERINIYSGVEKIEREDLSAKDASNATSIFMQHQIFFI